LKALAIIAGILLVLLAGYRLGSSGGLEPTGMDGAAPAGMDGAAPAGMDGAAPEAMDRSAAWQLVDDTRQEAGNDTARQSELLEERLSRLPGPRIVEFSEIRHQLDQQAYTWDLWGAAYVIEDGCSDDCFRDFRAYLISLGREVYEAALRDPDSLAPIVQDAEQGDWENADNVAPDAYESATGEDFPGDDSDLSGEPAGQPWDDEDQEALVQRYPALAARFR